MHNLKHITFWGNLEWLIFSVLYFLLMKMPGASLSLSLSLSRLKTKKDSETSIFGLQWQISRLCILRQLHLLDSEQSFNGAGKFFIFLNVVSSSEETSFNHFLWSVFQLAYYTVTCYNFGCVCSTCTRCCAWIEYTMSEFKYELIIPFHSELIILSLAGIWIGDLTSSKPPC